MQESTLANRAIADSNAQRRFDWENRMFRQSQLLWDMQRRADTAWRVSEIVRMAETVGRRPLDEMISQMEQSRGIQRLADLNHSPILGTALDSMKVGAALETMKVGAALDAIKVGEAYRKLIEPIPALKTVLQPPIGPFFSTVFTSARAIKPLAELQDRIGILTSSSMPQGMQIGSTIADTFKNISRVVDFVRPAYVENPFFGTESVAGQFSDLHAVVDYGRRNFASPDFPPQMTAILREILRENQALRADLASERAKGKWAKRVVLLVAVTSLLLDIAEFYRKHNSERAGCECLPQMQQQPSPPSVKYDADNVGPCP